MNSHQRRKLRRKIKQVTKVVLPLNSGVDIDVLENNIGEILTLKAIGVQAGKTSLQKKFLKELHKADK